MKQLILIFGAIIFANAISAQSCIPDYLIITSQVQIDNFPATYSGCKEVSGSIIIASDESTPIKNLEGLQSIELIRGDLEIIANHELTDLRGLRSLYIIGGDFMIRDNANLTTLAGLEKLTSIRQDFTVWNNDALTSFAGLIRLSTVGRHMGVIGNDALGDFTGLEPLNTIWGNLEISNNSTLSHLYGLDQLNSISKALYVNTNSTLLDFGGLDNLQSIGTNLRIKNNEALTNIEALQNLQAIHGDLRISSNNMLNSLEGLQNIDYQNIIDMSINNNANLSTCALTNICDYLSTSNAANVYDNATDCNSSDEIMSLCSQITVTDTPEGISEFSVFPIPSNDVVYLQLATTDMVSITINNVIGRAIHQQTVHAVGDKKICFDITDYTPGIYFISVHRGDKTSTKRFVKN